MGTVRSNDLDEIIIAGLADGIPLRELARTHGFSKSVYYEWLEADADFAGRIARARDKGFDAIAEETLDIADDGTNDWMERRAADGTISPSVNGEHVSRSKLRIETRLKLLAKWAPKKYGDQLTVQGPGEDGAHKFEAIVRRIVDSGENG